MSTVIACPNCAKSFRLPDRPPPTFSCSGCGTTMDLSAFRAAPSPPPSPPALPRTRRRAARSAPAEQRDPAERSAAILSMANARRYLEAVRTAYLVFASLLALLLLLVTVFTPAPLVPALLLAGVAVSFLGALRILREPTFWSMTIAIVSTAVAAGWFVWKTAMLGEVTVGLADVVAAVVTTAFWAGVPQAKKAARLAEAYPELFGARFLSGETRSDGRVARHTERSRAAARRRLTIGLSVVGGFFALVGVLVWQPWASSSSSTTASAPWTPPPPPGPIDDALARFSRAWASSDAAAIDALRPDDSRERQSALFKRILDRRGWTAKLPALGAAEPDPKTTGRSRVVYFPFESDADAEPLKTRWEWDGARWHLASMTFPKSD